MTRLFTGTSKIVNGPHDPLTDQMVPNSVGEDASGQMSSTARRYR